MEIYGRSADLGTRCDCPIHNKDDDNTRVYSKVFLFLCILNVIINILNFKLYGI